MKRLMIAAVIAASFALVAKADGTTPLGGVNFDNREVGVFDITDTMPEGALRWSRTGAESGDSEIVADTENDSNKFLKIDESGVLARAISDADGEPVGIPAGGGITVASKIQFTAQDAEDSAPTLEEGAKIAIWMKKYEATETTTEKLALVVTANKLGEKGWEKTNYEFDDLGLEEETWYNVEIKSELVKINGRDYTGFEITIGENTLDNPDGGLFMSLDQESAVKASIASLGFKGTGAADDLVFESYEKETEITIPVTITPTDAVDALEDATYQIGDGEVVDLDPEVGIVVMASDIADTDTIKIAITATGFEDYNAEYTKAEFIALAHAEGGMQIEMTPAAEETKEIKPGETVTDIVAEDEAAALAQVTIKPINDEAAEAGQAAVIKGKATKNDDGTWTVEPVIDESAEAFKSPDVVVETTLEQIVAGTDGKEVTVALPAEKVTPGLYYSVDVATELGGDSEFTEGERVLATSTGVSLKVTKPTGGKAFLKVSEHMAPTPAN